MGDGSNTNNAAQIQGEVNAEVGVGMRVTQADDAVGGLFQDPH